MAKNLIASLAATYRKRFPGPKVRIKRTFLRNEFATCHFDAVHNYFVITLDKNLKEDVALFILSHEWAHALSWGLDGEEVNHGAPFWTAWQKTYEIYEQFADQHNKELL